MGQWATDPVAAGGRWEATSRLSKVRVGCMWNAVPAQIRKDML